MYSKRFMQYGYWYNKHTYDVKFIERELSLTALLVDIKQAREIELVLLISIHF